MGYVISMEGRERRLVSGSNAKKPKRRMRMFAEGTHYFPHEGGIDEIDVVIEESSVGRLLEVV